MAKGENLGEFEQLVLTAVMLESASGSTPYGVTIHLKVEDLTEGKRRIAVAAVYQTLKRLEEHGLCKSWQGEPTEERGGRPKRYYEITGAGQRALQRSLRVAEKLVLGMKNIGAFA